MKLELGDIRWREGDLLVRGKGRIRDRMPLPKEAVPPIPDIAPLIPVFEVYADRARRALAAVGLKEAI